ncbi:hypothetical protein L873DRAFT_1811040, partial [Choiromyces venosus 120613-1]
MDNQLPAQQDYVGFLSEFVDWYFDGPDPTRQNNGQGSSATNRGGQPDVEKVACNVNCCTKKFPATPEGKADLSRHKMITHELKRLCQLLGVKKEHFYSWITRFGDPEDDDYLIAIVDAFKSSAVRRGLIPTRPTGPLRETMTYEQFNEAHRRSVCYDIIFHPQIEVISAGQKETTG